MRCTVLLAQLLGELAVLAPALHYARAPETLWSSSRAAEATGRPLGYGGTFGDALFDLDELTDKDGAGLVSDLPTPKASLADVGLDDDNGLDDDEASKHSAPHWMKSKKERAEARAKKYSAEFMVEVNMRTAHETGKSLGVTLTSEAEFWPAMVWRISKVGLIEGWNKAHPSQQVLLGDEIVRVNDIQWHANTQTFVQRIAGQFKAARKLLPGTNDTLRLYVQRPRDSEYTRSLAKRRREALTDVHTHDYAKEFTVELTMPDEIQGTTLDEIMGWTLNATEEWKPATIGNIGTVGSVALWNADHPDDLILEGDELLKIDNIVTFHHNVSTFLSRLDQHFKNAQTVKATRRSLLLRIQRPRPVQDAFDREHPVEEVEEVSRQPLEAQLQFDAVQRDESETKRGLSHVLGWELDESGGTIQVKSILEEGLVTRWNDINDSLDRILPGDEIVAVNGETLWNTQEFSETLWNTLASAGRLGPKGAPVRLSLARNNRRVRRNRQNMENGVHMDCVGCTTTTTEPPPWVEGQFDYVVRGAQESGHTPDRYGADDDDVIGASEE